MGEEMADGPKHPKYTSVEEQQAQGEMPAASADMEDAHEAMFAPVRGIRGTTEIYIGTPDSPRIDKRRSDLDEMEEDVNKVRKFNSDIEEGKKDIATQDHRTMNQTPNCENLISMMTCWIV